MHTLWHWILYLLAWVSADPATLEEERARAAGCVTVAYAAMAVDPQREEIGKKKAPEFLPPCPQCSDTGRIYRPDGGWVKCPCGACPTGNCKVKRG